MKKIVEFKLDYCAEHAIEWNTKPDFCVCNIINKALRLQDMKIIFDLRFFIIDLYNQLSILHSKRFTIVRFSSAIRATGLPVKDLNKIKNNFCKTFMFNRRVSGGKEILRNIATRSRI
jgi:hypothetical protein